ncbi:MAG: chromosome segregation protein SMC [Oligoflexus sp.]
MHLKKLIVSGFKSFADKVTLHFDDGITGIVGPNGSGKSNVIDAVRWVMGEQNAKHLRGQTATDIIFAGSDKRKALGMAEVTLVFDNAEASSFCPPEYRHEPEISLTRRLYIDGQREYLINRKPCRLKDIVGFFATTGLGGRSYSMIQQGQVDRILNAKPEDVREILEEAAGTIVFRNRRDSAQKKLAATNDNLSRIEDIVLELSRQLEALKDQVEKAKAWQNLSSQLKTKELSLFAHNFYHFTAKLQESTLKVESATDREVSSLTEISRLEAQVEHLQQTLAEADPDLDLLREDISKLREEIARAESSAMTAMNAIENGEKRLIEIEESSKEDQADLDLARERAARSEAEYDKAQQELQHFQDLLESFQAEVDEVEETARVFDNRSEEAEQEIRSIDRRLESNGLRCEAIERERQRLHTDGKEQAEKIERLQDELQDLEIAVSEAQHQVDERQAYLDQDFQHKQELEDQFSQLEVELKDMTGQRDDCKERFLNQRARYVSLQELEKEASDIHTLLKQLLEVEPAASELYHGFLTDFIAFQDDAAQWPAHARRSFELWSERLLVSDFERLNRLNRLVGEQQLGAIPVTVLQGLRADQDAAIQEWVERQQAIPLYRFLTIEPSAPSRVAHLLNRVFLLEKDHLDEASLELLPAGMIVFTANGVVLNSELDLLLSHQHQRGVLSRKAELGELRQGLEESQSQLSVLEEQLQEKQTLIVQLREQLKELNETLNQKNRQAIELLGHLQTARQQYEHTHELLESAQQQRESLKQRDRQLMSELEELGEVRIGLGQEREERLTEQVALREEFESIEERRMEIQRVHQRNQVEIAKLETKAQGLREQLEQNQSQQARLESTMGRRQEERRKITEEIELAKTREAQAKQEMEVYLARREELEEELAVRREKSSDILDELRKLESQLKVAREEYSQLQKNKSQQSFEIERLREACKALMEQAQERYHVDLLDFKIDFDPNFAADKQSKEVQSLRREIESLGAINMVAIEEYERLSERYNFIQAQKEEVQGSILLLEEAISEIEETSKEKFLTIFDVVNENFQNLFPILFPGGEARLEISDREDVLNSGVEIMVRMPGKTRRSMTLYSGGEKALTAISLIFALLKTKPTPFCFLDEVDAPLDEANVGRYNKVLEALSNRFQFIVITHNRRTMEVLDQLYGVTMQEGGVSTVVGVDMKKDLPDHLRKAFAEGEAQRAVAGASTQ